MSLVAKPTSGHEVEGKSVAEQLLASMEAKANKKIMRPVSTSTSILLLIDSVLTRL
jgi:hypothetical protein